LIDYGNQVVGTRVPTKKNVSISSHPNHRLVPTSFKLSIFGTEENVVVASFYNLLPTEKKLQKKPTAKGTLNHLGNRKGLAQISSTVRSSP